MRCEPPIPTYLSPEVQSLLREILVKDPQKRLGGGGQDAAEIKQHCFFKSLNWNDLAQRRIPAPFKPKITNELDVSNFAEEFTNLVPNVSVLMANDNRRNNCNENGPVISITNMDELFRNYSYVAPSLVVNQIKSFTNANNKLSVIKCKPSEQRNSVIQCAYGDETMFHLNRYRSLKPDIHQLILRRTNKFFEHYQLYPIETGYLGDGSFSICHRCVHILSGKEFAVKIVTNHRRRDSIRGSLYNVSAQEVQMLKACQNHRNIVRLEQVFQDEQHTFIVLELLKGGELLSRIRKQGPFSEQQAWLVFNQLVASVSFLHSKGIVHLDLKPEVNLA